MKKLLLAAGLSLLAFDAEATQIPLITGPQDVAGLQATLNSIIQQINSNVVLTSTNNPASGTGVLMALNPNGTIPIGGTLPGNSSLIVNTITSAVNQISISGGTVNNGASLPGPIIAATGTDKNIDVILQPQGTGQVAIASPWAFMPAKGLTPCPGGGPGGAQGLDPQGTEPFRGVVVGYFILQDWLGLSHWMPACG